MTDVSSQDVFDIMFTTRAMRRLKPEPVPDDLVLKILKAGMSAANGGNMQTWRFLVVKDIEIKKKVQVIYKKAYDEWISPATLRSVLRLVQRRKGIIGNIQQLNI